MKESTMKIYCFNLEECAYYRYLDDEEYKHIDFNNKFIHCPDCHSLAAYVPDDFTSEISKAELIQIYAIVDKVFKENEQD